MNFVNSHATLHNLDNAVWNNYEKSKETLAYPIPD
jgi:hypothetical protein